MVKAIAGVLLYACLSEIDRDQLHAHLYSPIRMVAHYTGFYMYQTQDLAVSLRV